MDPSAEPCAYPSLLLIVNLIAIITGRSIDVRRVLYALVDVRLTPAAVYCPSHDMDCGVRIVFASPEAAAYAPTDVD